MIMKNNLLKLSSLALSFLFLLACASNAGESGIANSIKVSANDDYVYIIDYEKIAKYEKAYKSSLHGINNYWINPPTKKITHAEYAELLKQAEQK